MTNVAAHNIFWQGEEGYERERLAAVWNELKPDRHPAGIVVAESVEDVVAAVRLARELGLRAKAVSGGHSWTASGVRDGSLLVRLKALNTIEVDPATRTATVGPGVISRDLDRALEDHDLFFPVGHAASVGIGGFLLQGGWGWNTWALGPACASVIGVDVVTASGDLVHADESQNADLLWAARGAGPGFFGIVTCFYVRVHPRPRSMMIRQDTYPLTEVDEVLTWAIEVGPSIPRELELTVLGMTPRVNNTIVEGPREITVSSVAISDSDALSSEILSVLDTCPVRKSARISSGAVPLTMEGLHGHGSSTEAPGYRYAVDNMWTSAGADDIVPAVREMFLTVPTVASHAALAPRPHIDLPDGALSVKGSLFIQGFTGWVDSADDARYRYWGRDHMRRMDRYADGIQLADEFLDARPEAKYLSDEAAARLESLRREWDPDGMFPSYLRGEG